MDLDPTTLVTDVLNYLLPLIPAKYAVVSMMWGSLVQSILSVVVFFWARKPPQKGTKARLIYAIISAISLYGHHESKADATTDEKKIIKPENKS